MALETDSVSPWRIPFRPSLLERVVFKDTTTDAEFISLFFPELSKVAHLPLGTLLEITSLGFVNSLDPQLIHDWGYFLAVQVNINGKRPVLNYQCGKELGLADFYMQFSGTDYLEQKNRLAEMPIFDALCLSRHHIDIIQIKDARSKEVYFRYDSLLKQIHSAALKMGIELKLL